MDPSWESPSSERHPNGIGVTHDSGSTRGHPAFWERRYAIASIPSAERRPGLVCCGGEALTAARYGIDFNNTNDEHDPDARSDAKGPEPEAAAVGVVDGSTYAFVGLERMGGIVVYDISDPEAPEFVDYVNNRDFAAVPGEADAGDLGPESLVFVSAADSPLASGLPMLVVGNEVSGTVTVYEITATP